MKYIYLLLVLIVLQSCATGDLMRAEIKPGVTKEHVIKALGQPDGYEIIDNKEILTYTNRLISGWSWDTTDYQIVIENNKVISYKSGEVRVKQTNRSILILPLK